MIGLFVLGSVGAAPFLASAQNSQMAPLPEVAPVAEAPAAPSAPVTPQKVSGPELSVLIRSTMVAMHHANVTGNYTVLRDLGSTQFQMQNSSAKLTEVFRQFREGRLNLAPVVIFDPTLDEPPQLTNDGFMRLVGHFATRPQQIVFQMIFQYEAGSWRIASVDVATREAPPETAAAAPAPGAPAAPSSNVPTVDEAPASQTASAAEPPAEKPIPTPRLRPPMTAAAAPAIDPNAPVDLTQPN